MKVCVQGLWHLGSVTAACLASVGHQVIGLDENENVISNLRNGMAPVFEPNLDVLIANGIKSGKLEFTNNSEYSLKDVEILWVTFDTAVDEDDVADINYVLDQVKSVIKFLPSGALVLVSSQLPVGSILNLENFAKVCAPCKKLLFASCPENLRLGKAINVFLDPDRVVIGTRSTQGRRMLEKLFSPITNKIEWMQVESAEMTKHAINSFLATSVAFANEIAAICELVGADAKEVERGLKSEGRIGQKAYLSPGGPFAGGTLARDIEFLRKISYEQQLETPLLSSVRLSNDAHKKWVQRKLLDYFADLRGVRIAIWGLTYKAGTNTLRRSLSVELVDWLLKHEVRVQVYDPAVEELPKNWATRVRKCVNALESLEEIQVLIVGTEWPEFKEQARLLPEFMNSNLLIIDANRYLQEILRGQAITYLSVGSLGNQIAD